MDTCALCRRGSEKYTSSAACKGSTTVTWWVWCMQVTEWTLLVKQLGAKWLNTVFDTSVSFTFFSKTLDPLVVKNGSKQVNDTKIKFLIIKLTYVLLPRQHD